MNLNLINFSTFSALGFTFVPFPQSSWKRNRMSGWEFRKGAETRHDCLALLVSKLLNHFSGDFSNNTEMEKYNKWF